MAITAAHGRVDDENNVFLFVDGGERQIGQYPGVPAEEALAFYERKFADIEGQVRILEQRVAKKLDAAGLKKTQQRLLEELREPNVIGDVANLRDRLGALSEKIEKLIDERKEENKEAIAAALKRREEIALAAQKIAERDPAKIQWKLSSAEMLKLFEEWQALQKNGPRVPKSEADPFWKIFSVARAKFEAAKRQYFASLDAQSKTAKAKKSDLVAKAEALVAKGAEGFEDYRKLLDEWKKAGRGNPKVDDALWARFKIAGDAIYAARNAALEVENAEQAENLKKKLELLTEAETIKPENDLAEAKRLLLDVQQRWEKIGKVPKDKVKSLEDRMRAVETKVRKAEQENWRKTDPATQDRTNSVLNQLLESIEKLETELKEATAKKDKKAIDSAKAALETRKAWLKVAQEAAK